MRRRNEPVVEADHPAEGSGITHALGFGVSQSGRFLRHFLELGMNEDSQGRRVFDGVLTHVAGAGKTFANHRFAMPAAPRPSTRTGSIPKTGFRSAARVTTDPFSGTAVRCCTAGRPIR